MERYFPLSKNQLNDIAKKYPTPFYVYDEKAINENAARLTKAFSVLPGFKEHFAVKGLPNPYILKVLAKHGFGGDCSSLPELILCEKSGISGEDIMFTSNETPAKEYVYAYEQGAVINLDDISHVDFLYEALGNKMPELISFRYNPGPLKEGNGIIGKPEEAKYGLTREQLFEAYDKCRRLGSKRFALHTMVASNELDPDYFVETARILYELVIELKDKIDIQIEFINIGGGIGIPYKPGQKAVDYEYVASETRKVYDKVILEAAKANPEKFGCFEKDGIGFHMECSRVITGPYGYLVARAIHEKHIYREYIGLDSCMADLMRPGMYGAYHHVSVPGKADVTDEAGNVKAGADYRVYDVVGSLCENCDKFAVQRPLPPIEKGDFVVIHDAGAHGRAMGFNYNGKLRAGELLLREDGSVVQIRRQETVEDYFATLDFGPLQEFC